jgi:hypothetical protein
MQDKAVWTAESRQATSVQNQCQRDGKIWVRGLGKCCQSAIQLGVNLPSELGKVSSPATVPGMLEQMSKTLSLLGQYAPAMEEIGLPVQSHIGEGHKIFAALQAADSTQERARSPDMPAAVAAFCSKKGELYSMLKVINKAGHDLFANNPAEAGRFNMSILHRYAPPIAEPAPTPPAPTPAA